MTSRGKNQDYWDGYNAEAARNARPGHFESLAQQVARALGRDNSKKAAIINANPDIFCAFDANELASMSAHEAAAETLKKRGVRLSTGEDGVRALELFNAGMDWGRARARYGGTSGNWAADSGGESFVDKYIEG